MVWFKSNLKKARLAFFAAILAAGVSFFGGLAISSLHDSLYEFKKNSINQIFLASIEVAEYFYTLEQNGELSRSQAQHFTRVAIRKFEFNGNNYIRIVTTNDVHLQNEGHRMADKLVFNKSFPLWGWVITTGNLSDQIHEEVKQKVYYSIIIFVIAVILFCIFSFHIIRNLDEEWLTFHIAA